MSKPGSWIDEGIRVRFKRDYYAPIHNWELLCPAGSMGEITSECSGIWVCLDLYHEPLEEWDNCINFDPEVICGNPLAFVDSMLAPLDCVECGRPMGEADYGDNGLCVPCTGDRDDG